MHRQRLARRFCAMAVVAHFCVPCAASGGCLISGEPRPSIVTAARDCGSIEGLVRIIRSSDPGPDPSPPPPTGAGFATPKVAAIYFSPMAGPFERALAARFGFALLGFYAGERKTRIQRYVDDIRAMNPAIRLGSYVVLNEYRDQTAPHDADRALVQMLDDNDWWARDAASGRKVQWTSGYGTWATNPTAYARPDASGRRWPQAKAAFDTEHIFGGVSGLDYVYIDQVNNTPWAAADYLRAGRNQSIDDRTLDIAYRRGMVDYWTALRDLNPDKKLIVNAGSLDTPEFDHQVEGALMECQIGKFWSYETVAGWEAAMQRYRAEMAQTLAPHDVVYQVCSPAPDPALMRYGLATAMLHDGYFAFTLYAEVAPPWFDEYEAPIGAPSEGPPSAPTPSGIWMRRYANGLVLVNPSRTTAASIDVGDGYKHLSGAQDPVVNNGLPERMVTLQPRSGLLMLRR